MSWLCVKPLGGFSIIVELTVALTGEWSEESSAEELIWTYLGEIFLVMKKSSKSSILLEIIIALEKKEYCTALFMDIERAFDKINHESLLQTIRKQFPEQIHQLIKSYLSSRTFAIKIKDTYSEVKDIKAVVSQGSVLGPILYTLYTANIPTTTNSTVLTFADDTSILVRHTNPETTVKLLQGHITKIEKWLQEKQIKANPNKCNHITFTLRKKIPPNILLNGTHIAQTRHVKYLELHLDTQLTWKQHTKSIIGKIQTTRRQMHWLTSRKSKLSIENKLKIYKTIIKSIFFFDVKEIRTDTRPLLGGRGVVVPDSKRLKLPR